MKKVGYVLFVLFGFVSFSMTSQVSLAGRITEFDTGKPIEFVNIGLLNGNQGTVSDFDGTFSFLLDESYLVETDTIQISRIGYKTVKFSATAFQEHLAKQQLVIMEPIPYELEGVVVTSSDAEKRRIGYSSTSDRLFGFWNDSLALGGEHASKMMVRRGPLKLEDLSFNIIANISDSLLVRVNVYEIEKGLPGKNISNGNIIHTIKQRQGKITINLSPYNIVVDDHFIISLELLKVYGGRIGIGMSASNSGFRSYTRSISQGRWKRMRKGFTIGFNINTSKLDSDDIAKSSKAERKREKPVLVKMLWDTSRSMENRDLPNELEFLDAYFKDMENVTVIFQSFSNFLEKPIQFKVASGNWTKLKQKIQSLKHDGGAIKSMWNHFEIGEQTLLFTDGKSYPQDIGQEWYGTLFIVNGNKKANHTLLKELAEDHGGTYINLEKLENMETAVSYTKYYIPDNLEYSQRRSVTKLYKVNGNVGDLDDPLTNVLVQVRDTERKTRTDSKGNFSIDARSGEVLDFSYPGRESTSSVVNTKSAMLKIIMPMGITALDEVVLEEDQKLKALHKPINKNISTRFGTLDMKRTGFAVKQMQGSEISPSSQTLMDAIEGKFPGVDVVRKYPEDYEMVRLRGPLAIHYLSWDVDGHVYPPQNPPSHINVQDVKDITIMPPSWAAARYGTMAPGGIIIVRTISNTFDNSDIENKTVTPNGSRTKKYQNDAIELAKGLHSKPLFAQRIAKAETLDEAYQQYLNERKNYGDIPSFYLESSKIFTEVWKDDYSARIIRSNIFELFPSQIDPLKIIAYSLEEDGLFEEALGVHEQILKIKNSLQAKRDLARILSKNGKYEDAWRMYVSYINDRTDFGSKELDKLVEEEILLFVQNHGEEVNIDKSQFDLDQLPELSLTVEWNDPNSQFELQFVDDQNNFFNWNNAVEISQEETESGNLSAMFNMGQVHQHWLINMTYSGNQASLPTYLKFTLRNNQTGEEKVELVTLRQKNVKYKVMEITDQGMLIY